MCGKYIVPNIHGLDKRKKKTRSKYSGNMRGVVCVVAQTPLQMAVYSTSFRQKSPLAGDEIIH